MDVAHVSPLDAGGMVSPAGSSCLLVIKAQHQGRRAFHVPRDERRHACETQLCRQRESMGMMEGGQERKDHEVGGEVRWQEVENNWRDHAKAKGHEEQ